MCWKLLTLVLCPFALVELSGKLVCLSCRRSSVQVRPRVLEQGLYLAYRVMSYPCCVDGHLRALFGPY
jgi:hypothetical protein